MKSSKEVVFFSVKITSCLIVLYFYSDVFTLNRKTYVEINLVDQHFLFNFSFSVCYFANFATDLSNLSYVDFKVQQKNTFLQVHPLRTFRYQKFGCMAYVLREPLRYGVKSRIWWSENWIPTLNIFHINQVIPSITSLITTGMFAKSFSDFAVITLSAKSIEYVKPQMICDTSLRITALDLSNQSLTHCDWMCDHRYCEKQFFISTGNFRDGTFEDLKNPFYEFHLLSPQIEMVTKILLTETLFIIYLLSLFGTIFGFCLLDLANIIVYLVRKWNKNTSDIQYAIQVLGSLFVITFTVTQAYDLIRLFVFENVIHFTSISVPNLFPDVNITICMCLDENDLDEYTFFHPDNIVNVTDWKVEKFLNIKLHDFDYTPFHKFFKQNQFCIAFNPNEYTNPTNPKNIVAMNQFANYYVHFKNSYHFDMRLQKGSMFKSFQVYTVRQLQKNRKCFDYRTLKYENRQHCIDSCVNEYLLKSDAIKQRRFPATLSIDLELPENQKYASYVIDIDTFPTNHSIFNECETKCKWNDCYQMRLILSMQHLKREEHHHYLTTGSQHYEQIWVDQTPWFSFIYALCSVINFTVGFSFFVYCGKVVRFCVKNKRFQVYRDRLFRTSMFVFCIAHSHWIFAQYVEKELISDCRYTTDFEFGPVAYYVCASRFLGNINFAK